MRRRWVPRTVSQCGFPVVVHNCEQAFCAGEARASRPDRRGGTSRGNEVPPARKPGRVPGALKPYSKSAEVSVCIVLDGANPARYRLSTVGFTFPRTRFAESRSCPDTIPDPAKERVREQSDRPPSRRGPEVPPSEVRRPVDRRPRPLRAREGRPSRILGRSGPESVHWHKPFTQVLDWSNPPFAKWFDDGELNVAYSCPTGTWRPETAIASPSCGRASRVMNAASRTPSLLTRSSARPTCCRTSASARATASPSTCR
ncbi:acetyl-coenzyme A synthetase N-terminal domain-containing protein [Microbacterium sp.]|uniref:acetyl-coenzyme A synthetase N-terminal domain-containing protein n=1 Tax=Microbacterium sp. TaxID=51671 RepID=UPI003A90865E